ncbi:MAG: carbon-nitrogen hydrolase family protein [Kiloniellales bacterium]
MSDRFKVACVQVNSGADVAANVEAATVLIRAAREAGADFITLPEVVNLLENSRRIMLEKSVAEEQDQALAAFRALARETGAWLLIGSLAIRLGPATLANRSYLLDNAGAIVARYDKIHMFDVDLPGGKSYRESTLYRPGGRAVVAETPWGRLGMSVCYDLRFPYLYRALAHAGATMLSIPSAFTKFTGKAHWHVLLRARAIETACFVIAPAQCGRHSGDRKTYGHSLVVDPWGEVLADGGAAPGFVVAEIDPAKVDEARRMVPSLRHDRSFEPPALAPDERRIAEAGE